MLANHQSHKDQAMSRATVHVIGICELMSCARLTFHGFPQNGLSRRTANSARAYDFSVSSTYLTYQPARQRESGLTLASHSSHGYVTP